MTYQQENNISNSKKKEEIRNLIRQTEFHRTNENLNDKSAEELKFQLALDYFSIVDDETEEGLLPVVSDISSLHIEFNSSLNLNSELLLKTKQACMSIVQEGSNSYEETLSGNNQNVHEKPLKNANMVKKGKAAQEPQFNNNSVSGKKRHPTRKNFDPKIVNNFLSEIMAFRPDVKWSDIAGLEFVKSTVQEIVIWPLLRPDIFNGLRAPPKGILLFGPPGTGKTLIGERIAIESNSTFFYINALSFRESEHLVRTLFAVAILHQPAVIFIDEIDFLFSQQSGQKRDCAKKLKTEFLNQFDLAKTISKRVIVVGATNRPHELDEAARRRFVKRLYVPLPEKSSRFQIIEKLLTNHKHNLSNEDIERICVETNGYSGSDVLRLCEEAAMGPIRNIKPEQIRSVSLDKIRAIELVDFLRALKQVRASVAQEDLEHYSDWNKKFGSFPI